MIRRAVEIMRPAPKQAHSWSYHRNTRPLVSTVHQPFAAIISLNACERFVFVMSILEGQSDGDCLSLLGCSRREIEMARELALKFLVTSDTGGDPFQGALQAWRLFLSMPR